MKRVAIFVHGGVVPSWSSESVPALEGLIRRLSDTSDVTVYTTIGPDGYDKPFLCGSARVKFVRSEQTDHLALRVIQTLRAFARDHREEPYDLVHGFWGLPGGLAAVVAGKKSGIPSIVSLLGGEAACLPEIHYGNMMSGPARAMTLWTCRRGDALTVLTAYQLQGLRQFGFNRSGGIHIIPFGAECPTFYYAETMTPSPPYHFLHIGHINRVKDQATLLEAFRIIRSRADCRLRIIGEDTLNGSLQRDAEEMGISPDVTFAGLLSHGALRDQFAWAHAFLHSSLYEGEGVVFAEAAASGVPVCGTNVGLLSDLGPAFSVTVPPGDYAALAREALALVQDAARTETLRAQSRKWAITHSAVWTAERFADLYDRIIAEHRGR